MKNASREAPRVVQMLYHFKADHNREGAVPSLQILVHGAAFRSHVRIERPGEAHPCLRQVYCGNRCVRAHGIGHDPITATSLEDARWAKASDLL